MIAAVYRVQGSLAVETVPTPEIEAGELLVRIDSCGVCGTDLKKIQYGLQPGPRVFGHEMAGIVARVGPGVTEYAPGDRVAVLHHVSCGSCFYCKRDLDAQCPEYRRTATTAGFEPAGGGFSQFIRVTAGAMRGGVIRVPENVSLEEATFIEPLNTCLKGVRKIGGSPGDVVMVVGLGPIGLMLAMLARRDGYRVIGVDPVTQRQEIAGSVADAAAIAREWTDGRGSDAAIVATPAPAVISEAAASVRPGGVVVLFANTRVGELASLDVGDLCVQDKKIVGSYSSSMRVTEEVAGIVFERQIPVQPLITHRYPLHEIDAALTLSFRPNPDTLKILVRPND